MTPTERAVIEAAMTLVANLDDVDATRALIDACSVLENERVDGPATFIDEDGDVWTRRENGMYSITGPYGFATVDRIRTFYGEQ